MSPDTATSRVVNRTSKLQGQDLNLRPQGYEPCELPDCSTLLYYSTTSLLTCKVAGTGLEPVSQGYEPCKEPLLQPATLYPPLMLIPLRQVERRVCYLYNRRLNSKKVHFFPIFFFVVHFFQKISASLTMCDCREATPIGPPRPHITRE